MESKPTPSCMSRLPPTDHRVVDVDLLIDFHLHCRIFRGKRNTVNPSGIVLEPKPFQRGRSMYLSYYNLVKKPFDISPNPEFLWLGEKHREGLATLKYGILENKGFLMITGDVGTGKTALIRAIENEIQAKIIVVTIPDPSLSLMDFYNVMAAELNMGRSFENKGGFLIEFKKLILKAA
ncbi:MAG: hypothetical protein EHM38_07895, partial [Geobacteraceae bacterium]